MCYDESFLEPIRQFIAHPTATATLEDIMENAVDKVLRTVQSEIEYKDTDAAIDETIQANDYEFDENGKPAWESYI